MTRTPTSELPDLDDIRNRARVDLFHCDDFDIEGVLFPGNRLHIHVDWPKKKLTPRLFRLGVHALEVIKRAAAKEGIEYIYVFVPASLTKFEMMFGWEPLEEWSNRLDPNENLILFRQRTSE